ncbi:MAG: acetyl-CoA hydrolase/transferase C-terminal domain-containing protein [Phycisphaerales bacterium]|nr:acetyl-CoA hydrolase/transferase family protein [Planctomycetota bacterium]
MPTVPSAADAVSHIKSGMNVFVHGSAATPLPLLEALAGRTDLEDVRLYHLHTEGTSAHVAAACAGRLTSVSFFAGSAARPAIQEGRAEFIPVFLSDIPALFTRKVIPLDAAIVQLSPADRHGAHTLGTSIDAARAAVDSAPLIIAEINARAPRTHGHTSVPASRIDFAFHTDRPLAAGHAPSIGPVEARIGELIAELVDDGATLQMGIGAIPDAVLARLANKHDLGVHTEMFSDGLIDLIQGGVITNSRKTVHPGRTVTSFVSGTQRLFDFVNDNNLVEFHGCDRTNDTSLIRKNPRVTAINSALEVDLSGQVCADSIGHRIYSGIGGQMDFIRGAALSHGGKPIIALPSTAKDNSISRITAELAPGAGVVTTRGHVQWVVTEYGAVNLHGRTLRQRGEALISIAHPDFRRELTGKLHNIRHFVFS